MAYQKKFQLRQPPEPRTDGSGMIDHDIQAIYSPDSGETWLPVPGSGYHRTISIPAVEAQAALSAGTNPQKVAAYKDAIRANANTQPEPMTPPVASGWSNVDIENYVMAYEAYLNAKAVEDDAAASAASSVNNFITVTLGLEYEVEFNL